MWSIKTDLHERAEGSDLIPAAEVVPVDDLTRFQQNLSASIVDSLIKHPPGSKGETGAESGFIHSTAKIQ